MVPLMKPLLALLSLAAGVQAACPSLKYNQSGTGCGQLTYHVQGNAEAAACEKVSVNHGVGPYPRDTLLRSC